MQPESPAQLGGKIYEMMGMALSGRWGSAAPVDAGGFQQQVISQTPEAEVIEPVEAGSQK